MSALTRPPFTPPATFTRGAVVVRDPEGRAVAEARRRGAGTGARWRWSATDPDLGTFVVEPADTDTWLVTRTDGAPFGRLTRHGWPRRRLVLEDGAGARCTVAPGGTVRDRRGRCVARIDDDGHGDVQLTPRADVDATWRSLLLAATLLRPRHR